MTDDARRNLFATLVAVLGAADAVTLMGEFTAPGETPASKEHVDRRFDALDERLTGRIAGLDARIDARIDGLEERLDDRIDRWLAEQRAETATLLAKHTRLTVVSTVAMNAATSGAVLTAASLL